MSEPTIRVHALDVMARAHWSFGDGRPFWQGRPYGSRTTFDPFPAYPHDLSVVRRAVSHVTTCQRPLWDVDLYVADREEVGRTNGHSNAMHEYVYDDDGRRTDTAEKIAYIVLSGKRIPPHPAMTRYLVGHEYGHHIEWMLNHVRGAKHLHDDELIREYADLRGLPKESLHHGEGGNWHDSATEIFACDFRIICCDVEAEFWPHLGVARPEEVPGLDDWWLTAQADLNAALSTS